MTAAPKPWFSKRILLFTGFGLLTLALYLYYLVGTANIVDVLAQADLLRYASAFMAFVLSVFFASLTWYSLLSNLSVKVTVRRVLLLTWFGLFFDATVPEPGWTGDLSKAYLLSKRLGQEPGRIVASVIGQKVISMAITVLDLILGLILLALNYTLPAGVLIFIAIVLAISTSSLATVSYLSIRPEATKRILDWLIRAGSFVRRGRWNSTNFQSRAEEMLNRFHEGIHTLSADRRALGRPIGLSLLSWVFDLSVVFLVFASLGHPVPVDKVLIVYALTGSLQSVGVSFVGFTEVVMSSSYTVLGVPVALSLSVTLLTRVVTLWFKLVVAYIAFQLAGTEILLDRKPKDTALSPEDETPTR